MNGNTDQTTVDALYASVVDRFNQGLTLFNQGQPIPSYALQAWARDMIRLHSAAQSGTLPTALAQAAQRGTPARATQQEAQANASLDDLFGDLETRLSQRTSTRRRWWGARRG